MLATEKVRLADWYKGIRDITKQLDETNIKILSAMWKFGPRNLLEVSRRTKIPFTSVYHRVAKLEAKSGRIVRLLPQLSKLGLARVTVVVTAAPGSEDKVTAALKIPNLWSFVNRCEGAFTHLLVNAVPVKFLKDFNTYIKRLRELNLITEYKIILTDEYIPNYPEFGYYDPESNRWTFPWNNWLNALKKKPTEMIEDIEDYSVTVDMKDLLIVKELQKDGRKSFAALAPILGISLQGVKYHFDKKLVPSGIVKYFGYDVVPFPIEISAYHEVMLKFTSRSAMNRFYSLVEELFFVLGVAKVARENALLVRTYIIQTQVASMFAFFSGMATLGFLESYSYVRLDFAGREVQTISYELFDEEKGWIFDLKRCVSELSKITRMAPATVRGRA